MAPEGHTSTGISWSAATSRIRSATRRSIQAGTTGGDPVVLEYELASRGTEPVWMPDSTASLGYTLRDVPVYLQWNTTRTTTRPVGYVLPPSMAHVVPRLLDHDIAVYRFRAPATLDAEVYYATSVNRDSYFQGHYLKSVDVRKASEQLDVVPGWFWIPTAQSRANLISYLLEPETDDNLITWGWADHVLEVRPETVEEALEAFAASMDTDLASIPAAQLERVRGRIEQQIAEGQRVPMMRVMTHQSLPVMRVKAATDIGRNEFVQP